MKPSRQSGVGHYIYLSFLMLMVIVVGIAKIITFVASPTEAETVGRVTEPAETQVVTVTRVPAHVNHDPVMDADPEVDPPEVSTTAPVEETTAVTEIATTLPETVVETEPIVEVVEYVEPEPIYEPEPVQSYDWTVPIELTPQERDAFAALIMLESQGESMECKRAVASVVLNRMLNDNRTLYEVLYADNQFEPAPYIASTVGNEDCYAAVDYVLANGPTIPRYVTYFAIYYFDFAIPYTVIDHTYFSYTQYEWERVNG